MTLHEFIFSKKWGTRFLRHIAFWAAQFVFWIFWAGIFYWNAGKWIIHGFQSNGFFILDILYTYIITYYFFQRISATKRLKLLGAAIFILTLVTYLLFVLHLFWLNDTFNLKREEQLLNAWYSTMNFIINGPPIICAMFLTFKMLKNYYLKTEEKKSLLQGNLSAELQLLKAQVHPHFLFNTLNNIYSFALSKSPQAGDLVLKLKNTLSYMINDCDAALVPLDKELKMIEDYTGLEKVRYGDRLDIQVTITGDYKNKMIAPLLMIPFTENCFKHGASKMRGKTFIKLLIEIKDNQLDFTLTNSKPKEPDNSINKRGIGLTNVQKRLQLLYPNNHTLQIESTDETYKVFLLVALQEKIIISATTDPHPELKPQPVSYA